MWVAGWSKTSSPRCFEHRPVVRDDVGERRRRAVEVESLPAPGVVRRQELRRWVHGHSEGGFGRLSRRRDLGGRVRLPRRRLRGRRRGRLSRAREGARRRRLLPLSCQPGGSGREQQARYEGQAADHDPNYAAAPPVLRIPVGLDAGRGDRARGVRVAQHRQGGRRSLRRRRGENPRRGGRARRDHTMSDGWGHPAGGVPGESLARGRESFSSATSTPSGRSATWPPCRCGATAGASTAPACST